MITVDTLAFVVRSLVRLGATARDGYEQSVRDRVISIPNLQAPQVDDDTALWNFFCFGGYRARVEAGGDLASLWKDSGGVPAPVDEAARQRLLREQALPER